ncbi:MAG: hypothetical protein RDU25_02480 [Patescibacteria group bacterium]|nr:hypothetical protein [Patescibacteria group bacterium]
MPENTNRADTRTEPIPAGVTNAKPVIATPVTPQPKKIAPIKPKFGKNAMLFIGVITLTVSGLLLALGVLVAKSGIVELTLLSRLYYGPVPARQLDATPVPAAEFIGFLDSRLKQAYAVSPVPPYRAVINEKEISGALFNALPGALRDSKWSVDKAQILVREDDFEYFSHFSRGALSLEVLIRMKPVLEAGSVRFDVQSIQVGDYALPVPIAQTLAAYYFGRDLGTWTLTFGSLRINRLTLHEGYVEIFVNELK